MIDAGIDNYRKAYYYYLKQNTNDPSIVYFLLLFYAVECGLKASYLKSLKKQSTKDIHDATIVKGHDITKLAKELKIPATVYQTDFYFRLQRNLNERYHVKDIHQAWRYHIDVLEEDETRLVAWLKSLSVWIKEDIK